LNFPASYIFIQMKLTNWKLFLLSGKKLRNT
jgi:hypothetical protein